MAKVSLKAITPIKKVEPQIIKIGEQEVEGVGVPLKIPHQHCGCKAQGSVYHGQSCRIAVACW